MGENKNPSVNRYLKDRALDHLDHALGRPTFPLRESYRNYFAIGAGSDLAKEFEASAYWCKSGQRGDMAYFHVTDAGRKELDEHVKSLGKWLPFVVTFRGYSGIVSAPTASKAKYSRFLEFSDIDPDLTFGAFAKAARVRRSA